VDEIIELSELKPENLSDADREIVFLMIRLAELIVEHWGIKFGAVRLIIHEGELKRILTERSILINCKQLLTKDE
jgi:hypothetical protein